MELDKNKVEKFIDACMKYLGNKYSQRYRLEPGYSDCSSIIQKALNALSWNTRKNVTVTTHRMGIEGDSRFREIPLSSIQRGDIVWWHKYVNGKYQGHVGVYLGDKKVLEAIKRGVVIEPLSRLSWQKAYRVVALEAPKTDFKVDKVNLKGKVSASILNIRNSPSTNGNVVGKLYKGIEVKITGKSGNWFEIGNGRFISGAYVDLINSKPIENVPIVINGKEIKKGYIIDGVTFMNVGGKDKPVRKLFENMGADVRWVNNKVEISL